MNMCQRHWDGLRAAIEARGLSHLVAKSGDALARKLKSQTETGENTKENFDPLMHAAAMIFSARVEMSGLRLLQPDKDGKLPCPLCCSPEFCGDPDCPKQMPDTWTSGPADTVLKMAQDMKLVASA